jgi:hypothetical protein
MAALLAARLVWLRAVSGLAVGAPGCMPEPGALLFLALVPADAPGWRQ